MPFLSFIVPIFAWNILLVSLIFLKTSLVFPILLFSSFSLHWLLRKAFFSLFAILWNSAFRWVYFCFLLCLLLLFFSQLFVKPHERIILPLCISFSWEWSCSLSPLQCHEPLSIVLQALHLPDRIPWISSSLPLNNCKKFRLYLRGLLVFPYFLPFKPEFWNKDPMIWATASSWSWFCWLCRASPSSAAKNIISWFQYWPSGESMCRVNSCAVGRECLLWTGHFLGKTLLAFALVHFILQSQICLFL